MATDSNALVGQLVVLDTAGPLVYLGTLEAVTAEGFWLRDADIHNRTDGHATNELYVLDAKREGIRVNRRQVLVLRPTVASVSPLAAVAAD